MNDLVLLLISIMAFILVMCIFAHVYKEKKNLEEQKLMNRKVNADENLMSILKNKKRRR